MHTAQNIPQICRRSVKTSSCTSCRIMSLPLGEFHETMVITQPEGENTVARVMPVDDDFGVSDPCNEFDHSECRNAGRVLGLKRRRVGMQVRNADGGRAICDAPER